MKHCPIHKDRPRPDLCHDCRRLGLERKLELTDSLTGQLEIVHLPRTDSTLDRIVVRPTTKKQ